MNHDGGPAFPCAPTDGVLGSFGMSLRDYFAAAALPLLGSLLTVPGMKPRTDGPLDEPAIAEQAYAFADAMLAERARVTP